jgi:hypothetical protein
MLRLWPVLIIAIGLDLMIGKERKVLGVVAGVVVALLVVPLLWWMAERPDAFRTEILSQSLKGADRAQVKLEVGVATLRLSSHDDPDKLIKGEVRLADGEELSRSFIKRGDTAVLRLGYESRTGAFASVFGEDPTWQVSLTSRVPLQLDVECGVGSAELDLRRLKVRDLRIESGVGRVEVVLPETGRVKARLHGGLGKTVVEVPASMEARIEATAGVGSVDVSPDFEKQGNRYVTSKYSEGRNRTDLQVQGGIGSIVIKKASPRPP